MSFCRKCLSKLLFVAKSCIDCIDVCLLKTNLHLVARTIDDEPFCFVGSRHFVAGGLRVAISRKNRLHNSTSEIQSRMFTHVHVFECSLSTPIWASRVTCCTMDTNDGRPSYHHVFYNVFLSWIKGSQSHRGQISQPLVVFTCVFLRCISRYWVHHISTLCSRYP